jgi:signal transduction histidine kinase
MKQNETGKSNNATLDNAGKVVAFEINDTGIGISKDKQNIILKPSSRQKDQPAVSMEERVLDCQSVEV